jgi:lysophospholipase L1-like esterase
MKKSILILTAIILFNCSEDTSVIDTKEPIKVSTIGDSRFSWSFGDDLRLYMDLEGEYDFIGSKVDSNGFKHDSNGGDNSQDLLDRFHLIPNNADVYVIMFGTNDSWRPSTQIPFVTLKYVITELLKNGDVLYVEQSPRTDSGDEFCVELDNRIINEFKDVKGFDFVDVRSKFINDGNVNTDLLIDHVHPSEEGIRIIAQTIANKIN